MVDELGSIENELAPLRSKIARAEYLRKTLRGAAAAGSAPDREVQIEGERFVLHVGPAGMQTVIHTGNLFKLVGPKRFVEMAGMTLAAVEAQCTPDIVAAVVSKTQTGPRSLKLLEKGAAAA